MRIDTGNKELDDKNFEESARRTAEEFFKKAFDAEKVTFMNLNDDLVKRIELNGLVKIDTSDSRGTIYLSLINLRDEEKNESDS